MGQLFPRRANLLARLSVYGIFVVAALGLIGLLIYSRSPYPAFAQKSPTQPVPFSHALHVGIKIDCQYCHSSVTTSASAGIPPTQTCMTCHSVIRTDSAALAPVRDSYATGKPIEWNRVHDLGDFVYFNHSIHVAKGVGCSTCHGQIDNMPAVFQENTLQMEWCIACHRAPENFIRPKSEVFNMQWQDGDIDQHQRDKLKIDYKIRSKEMMTSCSTCHR